MNHYTVLLVAMVAVAAAAATSADSHDAKETESRAKRQIWRTTTPASSNVENRLRQAALLLLQCGSNANTCSNCCLQIAVLIAGTGTRGYNLVSSCNNSCRIAILLANMRG